MIRVPVGQGYIEYGLYLEYMIWLAERNLADAWHYYDSCQANVVVFDCGEDAIAFKLKFGV